MVRIFSRHISTSMITLLAACGGSGDGVVDTVNNPLAKYAGTYYICNGHSKETVTVAASRTNSINLSII
jgi:hypothetical protein